MCISFSLFVYLFKVFIVTPLSVTLTYYHLTKKRKKKTSKQRTYTHTHMLLYICHFMIYSVSFYHKLQEIIKKKKLLYHLELQIYTKHHMAYFKGYVYFINLNR